MKLLLQLLYFNYNHIHSVSKLTLKTSFAKRGEQVPPNPHPPGGKYYHLGLYLLYVPPKVAQTRNTSIGEHRHCCVTFEI